MSDAEIENVVTFIKENSEESHYSEDLADHIERCENGENGVTDEQEDGDELLPEAIDLAVELGQISTAMIQRRLKVGYAVRAESLTRWKCAASSAAPMALSRGRYLLTESGWGIIN